ncbi:NAD(P)-dependent oxidoreductase [Salibacterium aidingense]|uniref:NAD(P)-dependent oxidoreductase n=1 Tax=Salibacterium aidingense TaxID=384933 RepID=UPI000424D96B|nr:NAD(P)-dependent oxidoreductase [Salibacterium aidingense]
MDKSGFKRIGFIGLGVMGSRMCERLLLLENNLFVYDISKEAMDYFYKKGAEVADSPKDISQKCDIILTSLPNHQIVENVVLGTNGMIETISEDKIYIDLSSSTPEMTKKIGKALKEKGVKMIDAPVSRGAGAAREGTLSIMVGGEESTLEECRFILDQLGTDILQTGKLSSGHMLKALNNLMSASNLITAIEGLSMAKKAGVDPEVFTQAINASSGKSHMTTVRFEKYYLPRHFNSNFSLELMNKDLSIALEVARKKAVPMMFSSLTQEIYSIAISQGKGHEDNTRIMEVVEELTELQKNSKETAL